MIGIEKVLNLLKKTLDYMERYRSVPLVTKGFCLSKN